MGVFFMLLNSLQQSISLYAFTVAYLASVISFDLWRIIVGDCFHCCIILCNPHNYCIVEVFLSLSTGMKLNPEMLIVCPEFLANYGDKEIATAFSSLPDTVLHSFHTYSRLILIRALNARTLLVPFYRRS